MQNKGFFYNLKASLMSYLALSASFEYLCYRSTAIITYSFFTVWGRFRRLKTLPVLKGSKYATSGIIYAAKKGLSVIDLFILMCFRYRL